MYLTSKSVLLSAIFSIISVPKIPSGGSIISKWVNEMD